MRTVDRRFDAIVIGSGAGVSVTVKELTECGLNVLLLKAGRDLTDADFTPSAAEAAAPAGHGSRSAGEGHAGRPAPAGAASIFQRDEQPVPCRRPGEPLLDAPRRPVPVDPRPHSRRPPIATALPGAEQLSRLIRQASITPGTGRCW